VCIANGKSPSHLTLALLAACCNELLNEGFNDSFLFAHTKHVKGLTSFLICLVSVFLSLVWFSFFLTLTLLYFEI
jgi:hypothetical protein